MKFYFDKFKKYAQYLLENKGILDELMQDYFDKIRSSNLPIMRFLEHLPAEQHKKITDKNIESFLRHSLKDAALEDSVVTIDQWKSNDLLGLPRKEIEITDILTVSNFRKQTYIDFLDRYTQDLTLFRSIVTELDEFHMQFQKYAFDSYVDIHQEELANENQFILSLINNSVDGILAFDKQLKITEFNHVLEKWHGIKKEDVIGKELLKIFSSYNGSVEGSPLKKALNGERTFIPESPFMDREGYYEANIVPLHDNNGHVTGGIIITHDVTNRKETEDEIKETKHLLQEVTDAVPNGIYVSELATKQIIFVNKEGTSLSGYSLEEVKSFDRNKLEQLIHPDDLTTLEEQAGQISKLKKGEVSDLNIRIKHKDGRWRWIRTKSKVFKYDENGEALQAITVFEDITEFIEAQHKIQHQNEELATTLEELKAAEEEVRAINDELEHRVETRTRELDESKKKVKQSEEQLRLITDAVPVHISYVASDVTYKFVNKAYEELFQRKKEDIIGKSVWEVIGEKAFLNIKPQVEKALNGEYLRFDALQDYGQYGKKWRNFSFVPDRIKGEVVGFFVLVEDISELKNIQLKLEEKNQELERANTDLENFIYTASHDLKSPILNMEGLMALLKKSVFQKFEPKERMLFEMIGTSVQRLQKTIGDLVEITKIQKEIEEAVEEPLRFKEISKDVKEDIYSIIQESNAVIKENYEVEEIIYKESSLRSILYNLLSNAVKYRHPDRPLEVELKTHIQDGYVVLSVKDNGLGLNPNQQKKLFTLFKRMHQHVEGTGVGLFMIKRIIDHNSGRIEVKSEIGKGTTFQVYLKDVNS